MKKILALFEEYSTTGGAEISNSLLLEYAKGEFEVEKVILKNSFFNMLPVNAALFFKFLLWKGEVEKIITEKKPDIVITQQQLTVVANAVAKKHHFHLITFVRDWWFLTPDRNEFERYLLGPSRTRVKKIVGAIDFFFCPWAAKAIRESMESIKVVTISKFVQTKLKQSLNIDAEIMPPPIEESFFVDKPAFRKKFNARKILFMGRLTPEKGVNLAIKSMAKVNAKLQIIGSKTEPYFRFYRLNAEMPRVRGKISFLGKKKHSEVLGYIKDSSVVIVPSLWQEPFGRVAIEAMATGTPVVATKSGGMTESTVNQLSAAPKSAAFSEKINYLLGDFDTYCSYANSAKKDAKKYSIKMLGPKFVKILKKEI